MRSNDSHKIGFIIGAGLLAMTAIYFAAVADTPKTAIVIGLASIACAIVALLDSPRDQLAQFDNEGVYDPRLGIGKIYWKEVREFYVADGHGNRFLCLYVQTPERFMRNIDRSQKRKMELNHSLGFKHINVDVRHLNISIQDLHRRIENRIEAAQQRAM